MYDAGRYKTMKFGDATAQLSDSTPHLWIIYSWCRNSVSKCASDPPLVCGKSYMGNEFITIRSKDNLHSPECFSRKSMSVISLGLCRNLRAVPGLERLCCWRTTFAFVRVAGCLARKAEQVQIQPLKPLAFHVLARRPLILFHHPTW